MWHGSGLVFQGGAAFARGDAATGGPLWGRGLAEMPRAVELQAARFDTLSAHARTQPLFGLADGHARLGDQARAREHPGRLQ